MTHQTKSFIMEIFKEWPKWIVMLAAIGGFYLALQRTGIPTRLEACEQKMAQVDARVEKNEAVIAVKLEEVIRRLDRIERKQR